jgi:hypothetical protein
MVQVNIFGKQDVFDMIEPEEALPILRTLINEDKVIAKRVKDLFIQELRDVDVEAIAEDVTTDLEMLDVVDLLGMTGEGMSGGHTDAWEAAEIMVNGVLEPHIQRMKRLRTLEMFHEEMLFCKGLIAGLYSFQNESDSEFKDHAEDICSDLADKIVEDWKASCRNLEWKEAMDDFLDNECQLE